MSVLDSFSNYLYRYTTRTTKSRSANRYNSKPEFSLITNDFLRLLNDNWARN